jgi:hypothetical protein
LESRLYESLEEARQARKKIGFQNAEQAGTSLLMVFDDKKKNLNSRQDGLKGGGDVCII